MARKYRIPFRDGKMMEYVTVDDGETGDGYWMPNEWRDVAEFSAELEVTDCRKGRSAMRFFVKNTGNGEEYSMGLHTFFGLIKRLKSGRVKGQWTFKKQGANYGLVEAGNDRSR